MALEWKELNLIVCGIGFGYSRGRKWCNLCHNWYPDDSGVYCPVHNKRFRLRPRISKARKRLEVPRDHGEEESYIG